MEQATIQNGFFVQGEVKFAVDTNDAAKTFEAVAALSHDEKIKLATLNDIPTQPYIKNSLTAILKSVVQNAWLTAQGKVAPIAAHTARLAKYKAEIAEAAASAGGDDLLSRKRGRTISARKVFRFTIDEPKYEAAWQDAKTHKNWMGQSYLVIKSMIELGAKTGTEGKSIAEILTTIKETRETAVPTRNGVTQIVNRLKDAGIVTCVNPEDAKKKVAKAPAPSPAPPTPPKQHTAPTGKKKH